MDFFTHSNCQNLFSKSMDFWANWIFKKSIEILLPQIANFAFKCSDRFLRSRKRMTWNEIDLSLCSNWISLWTDKHNQIFLFGKTIQRQRTLCFCPIYVTSKIIANRDRRSETRSKFIFSNFRCKICNLRQHIFESNLHKVVPIEHCTLYHNQNGSISFSRIMYTLSLIMKMCCLRLQILHSKCSNFQIFFYHFYSLTCFSSHTSIQIIQVAYINRLARSFTSLKRSLFGLWLGF